MTNTRKAISRLQFAAFAITAGFLMLMIVSVAFSAAINPWAGTKGVYLTGPVTGIITCDQEDATELPTVARTVRFNAAGTCKLGFVDGTTYSGTWVAGEKYDGLIKQVYDTGTSIADADIMLGK